MTKAEAEAFSWVEEERDSHGGIVGFFACWYDEQDLLHRVWFSTARAAVRYATEQAQANGGIYY